MSRLIIVSNRLPVSVTLKEGNLTFQQSVGGLSTGLTSIRQKRDVLWFGWPGIASNLITENQKAIIRSELEREKLFPVELSEEDVKGFYHGYANTTLWPLCHYFIEKTLQKKDEWDRYVLVNTKFYEAIKQHIDEKTTIWIHDYQLMLLPSIIRRDFPNVKIGYFHHIPFPSFELFRLLSTKVELLEGLLGADLIGFHTYDYVRHFLSSVSRILHLNRHLFSIQYNQRLIQVDAFPMGIDVDFFSRKQSHFKNTKEKIILSVDRLDYTKGIVERLNGFELFLNQNPSYIGEIKLQLIVAPSREVLESYDDLKIAIERKISQINGKYGTPTWMPIWYQYQAFSQEEIILRYLDADIMLVTPLRDGMNLVAKEYLATRQDYKGSLILSETAGASGELAEAFIINPTNPQAIADAIVQALITPKSTLIAKNKIMVKRVKRTSVHYWVNQFLKRLSQATSSMHILHERTSPPIHELRRAYQVAKHPIFVFDYDGTLMALQSHPQLAKPNEKVRKFLFQLLSRSTHEIAIISGREIKELVEWFKGYPMYLSGQHGAFILDKKGKLISESNIESPWKHAFKNLLYRFSDQMPGSFVEDKKTTLAFHYRQCEPDMVSIRLGELIDALESLKGKSALQILMGHKVIEIKDSRIDKGQALKTILNQDNFDFILVAGDDKTDEVMFEAAPHAFSIHIGHQPTLAKYRIENVDKFYRFIESLIQN